MNDRIVLLDDVGYGIIVTIPDMQPPTVTNFGTWVRSNKGIAPHKKSVAMSDPKRRAPRPL